MGLLELAEKKERQEKAPSVPPPLNRPKRKPEPKLSVKPLSSEVIDSFVAGKKDTVGEISELKAKKLTLKAQEAKIKEGEKKIARELENVYNLRRRLDYEYREREQGLKKQHNELSEREKALELFKNKRSLGKAEKVLKEKEQELKQKEEMLKKREKEIDILLNRKKGELTEIKKEIEIGKKALTDQEQAWHKQVDLQRKKTKDIVQESHVAEQEKIAKDLLQKRSELEKINDEITGANARLSQIQETLEQKELSIKGFKSIKDKEDHLLSQMQQNTDLANMFKEKIALVTESEKKLHVSLNEVAKKEDKIKKVKELRANISKLEKKLAKLQTEGKLRNEMSEKIKSVERKEKELDKQLRIVLDLQKEKLTPEELYRDDVEDLSIPDDILRETAPDGNIEQWKQELTDPGKIMDELIVNCRKELVHGNMSQAKNEFNNVRKRYYNLPLSLHEKEHYFNQLRELYDEINLQMIRENGS